MSTYHVNAFGFWLWTTSFAVVRIKNYVTLPFVHLVWEIYSLNFNVELNFARVENTLHYWGASHFINWEMFCYFSKSKFPNVRSTTMKVLPERFRLIDMLLNWPNSFRCKIKHYSFCISLKRYFSPQCFILHRNELRQTMKVFKICWNF